MKPVGRKCWTECYRLRPAEGAEKRVSGTTSTSSPDQGRAGRTDIVRTVESRPRQTDYLGRAVEIAERVAHGLKLPQPKTTRKIGLTMPLGHAFGLNHVKEDNSIMTPYIRVTQPSDKDVDRLAEQLLTAVKGDSPGVI